MRAYEWKRTPKARVRPKRCDLAWAAGFLEGEGSFIYNGAGRIIVQGVQTNREPLRRLQRMFGGSIKTYHQERRKPLHTWSVHGMRGRGVMLTLWAFMSRRRKGQINRAFVARRTAIAEQRDYALPPGREVGRS